MRASLALPFSVAAAAILVAAEARAQVYAPAEAPRAPPAPVAAAPAAPPSLDDAIAREAARSDEKCSKNPRCRLARFRRQLDHQRRQDYLRAVEEEARMMDERMYKTRIYRQRYPYEVDLLVISNLALPGALVAYAPTSWLRFEGFVGNFTQAGYDFNSTPNTNGGVSGVSYGAQARALPIKFALSPYAGVGLAFVSGSTYANVYDMNGTTNSNGGAQINYVTLGAGAELTLPYFHLAVGYQFSEPFYSSATVAGVHDETLTNALKPLLDNNRHGANVEVGVVF